jgi:hypothetical protein
MDSLATSKSRTASIPHGEASFLLTHRNSVTGARAVPGSQRLRKAIAVAINSTPAAQSAMLRAGTARAPAVSNSPAGRMWLRPRTGALRTPFLVVLISGLARAFGGRYGLCSHN